LVAVLLFAGVISVVVYRTYYTTRPPYCEQHDMYHHCQ
jgi:hypothetical protein